MAYLYNDANWSNNDLNGVMESVKKEISKSVFSIFSPEQLHHYKEKMEERVKEGHLVSLVDMWGLAIEYLIQGKVHKTLDCTDIKYILSIRMQIILFLYQKRLHHKFFSSSEKIGYTI